MRKSKRVDGLIKVAKLIVNVSNDPYKKDAEDLGRLEKTIFYRYGFLVTDWSMEWKDHGFEYKASVYARKDSELPIVSRDNMIIWLEKKYDNIRAYSSHD